MANGYETMDYDEKWSFRNFTNLNCPDLPDDIVVYASSFYWEQPDYETFRKDLKGVTFIKCNLDNLHIPLGNTVIDCHCRRFCCQNDGHDWCIDDKDKPVKLLCGDKQFLKRGLPCPTPADIPLERVEKAVDYRVLMAAKKIALAELEVMK